LLPSQEHPSEEEVDNDSDGGGNENGRFVGPLPGVGRDFDDRLTAQQQEIKGLQRTMDTKFDELKEVVTRGRTHALSVTPENVHARAQVVQSG